MTKKLNPQNLLLAAFVLGFCLAPAVLAGTETWTGNDFSTSTNWDDANNWSGPNLPPLPGDSLIFTGARVANSNGYPNGTAFDGITFDGNANAFTLWGNSILVSGNTNGSNIAIANNSGQTQTINLGLNLDWGYYTFNTSAGLNIGSNLTANFGGVADFGSGTASSVTLNNDPTGLIAGLGGAGLIGNTGLGAGGTILGTALGGFTGLACMSGGSVSAYNYPAAQQIGYQTGTLGFPIGADDITTLTTGFTVVTNTLSTGFSNPAVALSVPFTNGNVVSTLVVVTNTGITVGAVVTGTGVPANVTVSSIASTNISVSTFTATANSAGNYTFSQVVNSLTVANATGIGVGNLVVGTGIPANVTVTSIIGTSIGVTSFTCTAASTGNYTFEPFVNSVVVASATGIQLTAPFTGVGVPNGVTVTSINGNTIGVTGFYATISSSGNYAFATIASETPANLLLTVSGSTTAGTTNYPLAAGTSTTYGSNNTYINTITLANANAGVKVIVGIGGNANGGTLVLGSTNAGTGIWVGGIYAPNVGTAQGLTLGDGATTWITAGPMSGNPVPGEIIIAINGANTSNEGEIDGVIKDNLSGGRVTVVYVGGGSQYVNTTNSYSGGTYLVKGRVQWNTATAMGLGPVYVAGGDAEASLQNAGISTISNNFFIAASSYVGAVQEGAIRCDGTGVSTLAGAITLEGNPITPLGSGPADRISTSSGDVTTFAGQFTGSGTLEFFSATGTAIFMLANSNNPANNWTGGLAIGGTNADGCTVKVGTNATGGSLPNSQLAGNNVFFYAMTTGNARLDLNGGSDTVGGLVTSSNNPNLLVTNSGAGPSTLTLGAGNPNATFSGTLQGAGTAPLSIVKTGMGTQTINGGPNTYGGATTVNGGSLVFTGAATFSASTNVTVNTTGVLDVSRLSSTFTLGSNQVVNIDGGVLTTAGMAAGTGTDALNMNGGTLYVGTSSGTFSSIGLTNGTIYLTNFPESGAPFAATNLAMSGSSTIYIYGALPPITKYPSVVPLVQSATTPGGVGILTVNIVNEPATSYVFTVTNTGTEIAMNITGGPIPVRLLTWTGVVPDGSAGDWDIQNTTNWLAGGLGTYFNQGDLVTFNDTARGLTDVNLTTTLAPATLTVTNNLLAYTFSGSGNLTGITLGLVKEGTNSLAINNSGANNFSNGIVVAGGTLLLQDYNDNISGGLIVSNGGTAILDDSTTPTIAGNAVVYTGSTVQVGNNDGNGALPTGSVILNGGSTLSFDTQATEIVTNPISGSGSLIENAPGGSGTTQIGVQEPGFSGPVSVNQGTLQFGVNYALNGSVPISIANGGALDVNTFLGTNSVTAVQGPGPGGQGAIINSGASLGSPYTGVSHITLTGDTWLGGNGRWDLRSAAGTLDNPTNITLTCSNSVPYNLYKTGGNFIGIVACTVDPALANIEVQAGTLDIEGNTTGLGNPTNTLTVDSGAILQLYEPTNHLNKVFVLNDGSTVQLANGAVVVAGPVNLNTNTSGGPGLITIESTGGTSITFDGPLTNVGNLSIRGGATEPIYFAGANTYTGTTAVTTGTLDLIGTGAILNSGIAVSGGATFDVSGVTDLCSLSAVTNDGTFNLGNAQASIGTLDLDGGAMSMNIIAPSSPAVAVNTLIVGGGSITVNPPVVLSELTIPLISYQTLPNGPTTLPSVTITGGAQGVISNDTVHEVLYLVISPSTLGYTLWNGGSATDSVWSDAANWGGTPISASEELAFGGTNRLNNTNDTTAGSIYGNGTIGIGFASASGPFILNGNWINLGGSIISDATSPEVINLGLDVGANTALEGVNGPLIIADGITNTLGTAVTIELIGTGTLSNLFGSNPQIGTSGENFVLHMTNTAYNWTLLDNPSSTPIADESIFEINGGTFNFGNTTDVNGPVFSSYNGNGDPSDYIVGQLVGQIATFNMFNGSFTTLSRLDTGASVSGAVGNVNVYGGTMTIGSQIQMDNIGGGTSTFTMYGGTVNVGTAATPTSTFFVASRGTGTLNINGGALNCGTLDVSRGIGLPTIGVVNLNSGGTLTVTEISTATANTASPVTGASATFNFNGGILQAGASSATFVTDSSSGATLAIPLTVSVSTNGAIINDNGFAITIAELLQHDARLGSAADGGLTKQGAGSVTLSKAVTYTGNTTVSAGTLSLTSGVNLNSSPVINVAAGATLSPSGGLTLVNNQTLMGGGAITGTLAGSGGSTIAPGASSSATGTLTASGGVTLQGATLLKINGTANDELVSTGGSIIYGGTLVVTNIGGPLTAGTPYALFSGAGYPDSFSSITLPSLGANLAWQTNLSTAGSITVVSTLPPTPPVISSFGQLNENIVFSGTNGPATGTYYVLSSTNLALPLTEWTRTSTNTFNAGNFSVTNPIITSGPQTFFIIEIP